MKLSIIIPVYRVEATLDRCIKSVLSQNLDDFEVILIDDGSPDNCPKKCDDWSKKDSHIQVIHQENQGLSAARNAGIDLSQGDYITFIDSDDYLTHNTLRENVDIIEKHPEYDFIEYPILVYVDSPKESLFCPPFQVYTDMKHYWLEGKAYHHTYACNKIFKRTLFDSLRFPLVPAFEDAHMLPMILDRCNMIATTNIGLYYYTWNPNGISVSPNVKEVQSLLDAYLAIMPRFINMRGDHVQDFYLQALNTQMEVTAKGGPITLPSFNQQLHPSRRYSLKTNVKIIILKTMGIKILCHIYKRFFF
jgi:glycosyltransferase involved in cell wall biosynthesis